MRALAIILLALMSCGCAAGRQFDLVARDPEAPWQFGQHRVRVESSRSTISADYDRTWLDHMIFEVEVVNQTDSAMVVDPERFSYTLASSGAMPSSVQGSFAALAPSAILWRVPRAAERSTSGNDAGRFTTAVPGLVILAAFALNVVEFGDQPSSDPPAEDASSNEYTSRFTGPNGCQPPSRESQLQATVDHYAPRLLQWTKLPPGGTVRGEVWLPAWPVCRVAGMGPSDEDHLSITSRKQLPPGDHQLTLHTPRELGGEEIEFSVAPYW